MSKDGWRRLGITQCKSMSKALFVSGIGFILLGVAMLVSDCQAAFEGGSCGSATVARALESTDLVYFHNYGTWPLNDLMLMPFSYAAMALGVIALAGGGLTFVRGI